MALKNVRIVEKAPKKKYEDKDTWEKSSDVRVFSLFDQDWQTIEEEGLSYLFNESETEFNRRKEVAKCKKEMAEEVNEVTETTEGVDETTLLDW